MNTESSEKFKSTLAFTDLLFNVLIGFASKVFTGKVLFANVKVPEADVSNTAFFKVNFISSICSAAVSYTHLTLPTSDLV